jgi:aminoglycoside phosphotransferase
MTLIGVGKSEAKVYRLDHAEQPALYLKLALHAHVAELHAEHQRLLWLQDRVPVARIVGFDRGNDDALLLTRALTGANALDAAPRHRAEVVAAFARALRHLHSLPTSDCRFDQGLDTMLQCARRRVDAGRVDESDFDPERKGATAAELLQLLEQSLPPPGDRVLTHGDACLANVIFDGARFRGFVDCVRSGLADRYQDLALASRSIEHHYGSELVAVFFERYGLARIDQPRLGFYRLLDEFF